MSHCFTYSTNVMAAKRITKRTQYINELVFDKQHFEECIKEAKDNHKFFVWYLGEQITVFTAKKNIEEIEEELKKLSEEPNYKPYIHYA